VIPTLELREDALN